MDVKKRSIISILSLALALVLMLAALPLQAEEVLPDITGFQFDGIESTNSKVVKWKFSWDSVTSGSKVKAQVNAAAIGSFGGLWVSVDVTVSRSGGKTRVSFYAPKSNALKVRFQVSNSAGQSTSWLQKTVSS